jgi:hypothetical protein
LNWAEQLLHSRTEVHGARSFLVVTHPSTNRDRRDLTSVNEPLSYYIALVTTAHLYE